MSSLLTGIAAPRGDVGPEPLASRHLHVAVETLRDELTRIDVADNYWLSQLHHRVSSVLEACLEFLPAPDEIDCLSINARAEGIVDGTPSS